MINLNNITHALIPRSSSDNLHQEKSNGESFNESFYVRSPHDGMAMDYEDMMTMDHGDVMAMDHGDVMAMDHEYAIDKLLSSPVTNNAYVDEQEKQLNIMSNLVTEEDDSQLRILTNTEELLSAKNDYLLDQNIFQENLNTPRNYALSSIMNNNDADESSSGESEGNYFEKSVETTEQIQSESENASFEPAGKSLIHLSSLINKTMPSSVNSQGPGENSGMRLLFLQKKRGRPPKKTISKIVTGKRGRPRKYPIPIITDELGRESPPKESSRPTSVNELERESPPKESSPTSVNELERESPSKESSPTSVNKRKREKPSRYSDPVTERYQTKQKRKRGRPPKHAQIIVGRKRGRPPKNPRPVLSDSEYNDAPINEQSNSPDNDDDNDDDNYEVEVVSLSQISDIDKPDQVLSSEPDQSMLAVEERVIKSNSKPNRMYYKRVLVDDESAVESMMNFWINLQYKTVLICPKTKCNYECMDANAMFNHFLDCEHKLYKYYCRRCMFTTNYFNKIHQHEFTCEHMIDRIPRIGDIEGEDCEDTDEESYINVDADGICDDDNENVSVRSDVSNEPIININKEISNDAIGIICVNKDVDKAICDDNQENPSNRNGDINDIRDDSNENVSECERIISDANDIAVTIRDDSKKKGSDLKIIANEFIDDNSTDVQDGSKENSSDCQDIRINIDDYIICYDKSSEDCSDDINNIRDANDIDDNSNNENPSRYNIVANEQVNCDIRDDSKNKRSDLKIIASEFIDDNSTNVQDGDKENSSDCQDIENERINIDDYIICYDKSSEDCSDDINNILDVDDIDDNSNNENPSRYNIVANEQVNCDIRDDSKNKRSDLKIIASESIDDNSTNVQDGDKENSSDCQDIENERINIDDYIICYDKSSDD